MKLRRGDIVADCGHIDSIGRPEQDVRLYRLEGGFVTWDDGSRVPCRWIIACFPCSLLAGDDVRKITLLTYPAPHTGEDVALVAPS